MCNCNCNGGSSVAGLDTILVGQLQLVAHRLTSIEAYVQELNRNMATSKEQLIELVGSVNQTNATVARIYTEVTTRTADLEAEIDRLEEKVANETITTEDLQPLRDSLATVNQGLKQIDDLNTDPIEVPEPTEPETPEAPVEPAPVEGGEVVEGRDSAV